MTASGETTWPSAGRNVAAYGEFPVAAVTPLQRRAVSYTGITLTDTTNNVSTAVPDASRTFVNLR